MISIDDIAERMLTNWIGKDWEHSHTPDEALILRTRMRRDLIEAMFDRKPASGAEDEVIAEVNGALRAALELFNGHLPPNRFA